MRLAGKRLLILLADGVNLEEYRQLRKGFESEEAILFSTAPERYGTVESVEGAARGEDIVVDIPMEAIECGQFDGLIVPSGVAAVDSLRRNRDVIELVRAFHARSRAIFACGVAIDLLRDSGVISDQIMVREDEPVMTFVDKAVDVLLDAPFRLYGIRRTPA